MGETQGSVEIGYLRVAEVADAMQVPRVTVYQLVREGKLPAVSFGKLFRIPALAVRKYLAAGHHPATSDRRIASG